MLGHKRLAWRSVTLSPIPPRPYLEPLVGAYRRTPVLQIGAHVYCDTRCIAAYLERTYPEPTLLPASSRGLSLARALGRAARVRGDRAPFMRGALDVARIRELEPASFDQVSAFLATLECALRDSGGPFLAGPSVSLADLSAGHLVWWLDRTPRIAEVLDPQPAVCAWLEREPRRNARSVGGRSGGRE